MDGQPTNQPTNRPTPSAVDLSNSGHRYCSLLLYVVTIYKWESLNLFLSQKLFKHKFRVLLAGHTFAVVTSSSMIEHLFMPLLRSKRRWSRMVVLHKKKC